MRTTKPTSTISYNTEKFLEMKLDEFTRAGILSFWAFIHHLPEDDEGGKKEHLHVYVEPAKMLQTDELRAGMVQLSMDDPEHPLGCISFRASKFDDWYLYALHDKAYLASKGQSRRYRYRHDQIVTSDPDDLNFKAKSIDRLAISPYAVMLEAIEHGATWSQFFARGLVPITQLNQWEKAWQALLQDFTDRDGAAGHDVDPSTGEIKPVEGAQKQEGV